MRHGRRTTWAAVIAAAWWSLAGHAVHAKSEQHAPYHQRHDGDDWQSNQDQNGVDGLSRPFVPLVGIQRATELLRCHGHNANAQVVSEQWLTAAVPQAVAA